MGRIARSRPSGMAMSWLWTRMSVSVSSGVTKALCRREPIMALIREMISGLGSTCACSTAESWIVAFRVTLRSIRGWWATKAATSRTRCCCRVRWAATCRTVQPWHSDGWSHCFGRELLEQVGGACSLVVDRGPHGIRLGWGHRGHLVLRQVKTGGLTRVRLSSKNCG